MSLYGTRTYRAAFGEHEIDFEFDRSGVIVNRGRLLIDGVKVDQSAVHYGESAVHGQLDDGRGFKVSFGSGVVGQLKHVELRLGDETIPMEPVDG